MRPLSAVLAVLLLLQSCATLGPRTAGTSDSNSGNSSNNSSANSSNGSNNSSGNSNNSSANSNNSSKNSSANSGQSSANSKNSSGSSNNTSYHSNQSSQNSRHSSDSNASSRDSSNNTTDDPNVQNFSIALAGSALLVTTGVAVGLILYFALRTKAPAEPSKLRDDAAPAAAWLRANKRQLQADLALGAGPTLDDLASAAEIRPENLPRFCALLSAHRGELLAPLREADDVSLETAVQVMSRVGELTIADPVLKADADAFLARHPEG